MTGRRDCMHPIARHVHGTRNAYVCDRCRCDDCRAANSAAERARSRAKAYGRHEGYVDAEPVRQHLRALMAAGIGLNTIRHLTGLSGGQLCSILYGRGRRGATPRRPQRGVTPSVRDRVLSVPLSVEPADHAVVDATGTTRRLQALVAIGWSQSELARRLGMASANFSKTMRAERVLASTARAVRDLYDRLWDQQPPQATHPQRVAASRARNRAVEKAWVPPLDWDDDTIDDPLALPASSHAARCPECSELFRNRAAMVSHARSRHGIDPDVKPRADRHPVLDEIAISEAMAGRHVRLRPAERAEAVRRLTARGMSAAQIGERLGTTGRTVQRRRAAA